MIFYDFEYDGLLLSDFGFITCSFDSSKTDTVSMGSKITFKTTPVQNGAYQERTSYIYKNMVESTFQICKNVCDSNTSFGLSVDEQREIMRWLSRKEYLPFRIMNDDYLNIYFEASFNVSKIEINGEVVGFELDMQTNRPFAIEQERQVTLKFLEADSEKTVVNLSDDEGSLYPKVVIECNASGNLIIENSLDDHNVVIANCSAGEIITMDNPIIESNLNAHEIQNDFNWNFLKLVRNYRENINKFKVSLPCTITLTYKPIVKITI